MTTTSGAGTPGSPPPAGVPASAPPAGAPAPTAPGAPATGALGAPSGAPAPATPAAPAPAPPPATPAAPVPAITADDIRAWLALRGVAVADMDEPTVRGHIDESLDGCTSDRQLGKTLGWIRDALVAAGRPAFDPTGVTIVSLQSEIAAAAAAMAPPAPRAPKAPSRVWLAVYWCLGAISWALKKIRSTGRTIGRGIVTGARAAGLATVSGVGTVGRGFSTAGQAIGRRWKPILIGVSGLVLLAGLTFGAIKGYEWWQIRAHEAAHTPPAPPPPVVVTPTPEPPPVVVIPTPEPPPVVVAPTPAPVIPGPTGPAIYHSLLDMECLMYGRLQSCNLPPGCTEGFLTNPPRLQVSCPGGVTYIDGKSMTAYPANKRVSVRLNRQ